MNAPEPRDRAAAPEMVAPQRDRQAERTLAGVALAVLAVACFATLDTATKVAVATVPIWMGVWFRYTFQALATTAVLLPVYGPACCAPATPATR